METNNIESNIQLPDFTESKNGMTSEVKQEVWDKMKDMGLKLPNNDDFTYIEDDITDINNIEEILTSIVNHREEQKDIKIRQTFKGLQVKEYFYNESIIESYAKGFGKTKQEIKDAIIIVFNKHFGNPEGGTIGTDYIKKNLMIKLLDNYFNGVYQEEDGFSVSGDDNSIVDDGFDIGGDDNSIVDDGFNINKDGDRNLARDEMLNKLLNEI